MKIVVLWTDALIFILLAMLVLLLVRIYSNAKLRSRWQQILYRPLNFAAVFVLCIYSAIGILDTIHFKTQPNQNDNEIISLLDAWLMPLPLQSEKTYSAPFATHAFGMEAITLADGKTVRDYPRLVHGGKHLKNPNLKSQDIQQRFKLALSQMLLVWGALSIIMLWWGWQKSNDSWEEFIGQMIKGQLNYPWRTLILLLGMMLFGVFMLRAFLPYYHILGTSQVGEDVFYQALKGIRTGLVIGTITTLITLPFAIFFGVIAGYFKGWLDDIIQFIYTTLSSIPGVLLIAAAVLSLEIVMNRHLEWFQSGIARADARLLALCAILGITSWTSLCRLLRAETLKICEMDYIQAAYSLGVSHAAILLKHVIPNISHIILITVVLDFSGLVLAEAVLSYVGVGVDPASYSWGTMINSARLELAQLPIVWWNLTAVFVFMLVLVLAANIFADALRDALDPRSHNVGAM